MGKSSGDSTTGYRYYFDLLMGLCRGPIDQLVAIDVGGLEAWPHNVNYDYPSPTIPQLLTAVGTDAGALYPLGDQANPPVVGYGGSLIYTSIFSIQQGQLFGGDKQEGGILGDCTLNMGHPTQIIAPWIVSSISTGTPGYAYFYTSDGAPTVGGVGNATNNGTWDPNTNSIVYDPTGVDDEGTVEEAQYISSFRGVTTAFFSGQVCSNNPYPKKWAFRVRRAIQGWDKNGCWYPDKAIIAYSNPNYANGSEIRAMNPAHILYQVITDRNWGRGMDRAEMDDTQWTYAANYLYNEGFGLNLRWSKDTDISNFIQTVIDHIQAVIYTDRKTGLVVLRLIRDDYDVASLPTFDYNSGLLKVDVEETGAGTIVDNEVIVKYIDPISTMIKQTRAQNLASIQSLGGVITHSKTYEGIGWSALATRVALRDLQIGSAGLKKFKLKFDRRGWKLQPGDVCNIAAPDKGITNMIVRIVSYDDGTITDGTVTIDALQDAFGMPSTAYTMPETTSDWIPKIKYNSPPLLNNRFAYESTYYDMYRQLSASDRDAVTATEGAIVAVAQQPVSYALNQLLQVTVDGGTPFIDGVGDFCPAGFVGLTPVGFYDTTVQLTHGTLFGSVTFPSMALLGSEMVRVDAFNTTTGVVTIARGCVDTLPQQHNPTTVMFFSDSVKAAVSHLYELGETVAVQQLSRISTGTLDPSLAPATTLTIASRHVCPYPPANMQLNGAGALSASAIVVSTGSAVFTWVDRNALTQADQLVGHTEAAVAAPSGTTYRVEVWDTVAKTLIRSHTGITSDTYTYNTTEATSGSSPDPVAVTFKIYATLAGNDSYNHYSIDVLFTSSAVTTGWNNSWTYDWSGV